SRAEVEAFVGDESEGAYGRLVERLLASPRYGERWARHWLDVVHFGETHGYDKDKLRPNAWPYRDYVIRAFNEDKPYGRFVREQLAGDVFWPGTVDGVVGTGFIAAGPWDFIGHAEVAEEKIDGQIARHLDRDDMVTTAMNTFCSLTVQCAQCHDHKIDPVTMRDYYALQAVFAAVDRADRDYDVDPATGVERERLRGEIGRLGGEEAKLGERIEAAKTEEIGALEVKLAGSSGEGAERSGRYGYHSQVAREQDAVKWVQVDLGEAVAIERVVLVGADEYGFADFGFPHRFRVEVSETEDFSERVMLVDYGSEDFARPGGAPVGIGGVGRKARYVRVTATKLWSRRRVGEGLSGDWIFALGELAVVSGGELVEVKAVTAKDSIEALPRWGKADLVDGVYGKYARAEEGLVAWLEEDLGELRAEKERLMREVAGGVLDERKRVRRELEGLKGELGKLPKPGRVYAGTVHTGSGAFKGRGHVGGEPREIFVLARGEVTKPGERVAPGTVPGIVGAGSFELGEGHLEGERRAALAEWVTHPENGLTWRSIVNRV
ncbi:MAG: DUF1549 domain-containing protein, partial [Verrucomicrobiales bacterium]|nr:DUF1549 domain-containing protein [Verrucomicrobiales bacterium]